jgi:hypothetical protein
MEKHHPYCETIKMKSGNMIIWSCSCYALKKYDKWIRANMQKYLKDMTVDQRVKFVRAVEEVKPFYNLD